MQIEIPALDKFLKEARPWGVSKVYWKGKWHHNYEFYDQQRTNPEVIGLLKILGMKKNQKVLCVAGHKATWALALARAGVKVIYSDLSEELVKYVKKNVKHKNLMKYSCLNYVLSPSKPNEYDWSFTFEAVGPRQFIFLLAILNKKGGKYVIWDHDEHAKRKFTELAKTALFCNKIYHTKSTIASRHILSEIRTGEKKKRKHHIITLYTNDDARSMMLLDMRVFRFLSGKQRFSMKELSKKMSCSEIKINESLKRISSWKRIFERKYFRNMTIE